MNFSDLDFHSHGNGIGAKHFFPNGYGISVIKFPGSYGFEEGLYEVAILKGLEEDWQICYDTPITNDVIGHQSQNDVESILYKVENL